MKLLPVFLRFVSLTVNTFKMGDVFFTLIRANSQYNTRKNYQELTKVLPLRVNVFIMLLFDFCHGNSY